MPGPRQKRQIFLSHSGRDAERATELARKIEAELQARGIDVEVFNTSEPEHRFQDLRDLMKACELWKPKFEQYDRDLRGYLRENLGRSAAFLALVTPHSLHSGSAYIEYEMQVAQQEATAGQRVPFLPCVADGVSLTQLPPPAETFQGIDLEASGGVERLVGVLERLLARGE